MSIVKMQKTIPQLWKKNYNETVFGALALIRYQGATDFSSMYIYTFFIVWNQWDKYCPKFGRWFIRTLLRRYILKKLYDLFTNSSFQTMLLVQYFGTTEWDCTERWQPPSFTSLVYKQSLYAIFYISLLFINCWWGKRN